MIFSPYEEALLLNNFYLTINAMDDFASSASRLMYCFRCNQHDELCIKQKFRCLSALLVVVSASIDQPEIDT
jgi:hypothetical protein